MKSILSFSLIFLLFALTAAAAPIKLQWNLGKGATLETRGGKQYLRIVGNNVSRAKFNPALYAKGELVSFTIRARARDVTKPPQAYNGVKFMWTFVNKNGRQHYNTFSLYGTFDWREIAFNAPVGDEPCEDSELVLGLQDSTGEVEFDLSSLRVAALFNKPSVSYKAAYSEEVASTPPLRGVMSPYNLQEKDFDTLKEWNVNLVRVQLVRNWLHVGKDRDLAEYDSWLDGMLAHYEKIFPVGYRKGIRFILDLHTPPGGWNYGQEMTMLTEKKYADHFVEVWKRIATRFKDNPAVWAYDLINEPIQRHPVPYDYYTLQCRAAEAIRKIDPERPVIVVPMGGGCENIIYLTPLKLKNIIYEVHMYVPMSFTHQGVHGEKGKPISYPGPAEGRNFNKEELRRELEPVREFQKKYGARIYTGEFSAIAWAPGAEKYIGDLIELFEEYGWDWTFHAFREWSPWSVEHEGTNPSDMKPAREDTPRKKVLLKAFRKNKAR